MKRRQVFVWILALLAGCFSTLQAQDSLAVKPLRPVASAFTVELGSQSALDTYLVPIRYQGLDIALGYERMRATSFAPDSWLTRHVASISLATMSNPAGNGSMLSAYLDYSFSMMRYWQVAKHWQLAVGGEASLTAGVLYNRRNSNNPANAKAAIDFGATGMASYHFHNSRLPITLRYQMSLPVVGVFFSPEFGESYYEMFRVGNHSGLTHLGAWHNRFDMRNYLSVDLHLGKRALRLGYRNTLRSTHVNHLDCQVITHTFVLGFSGEWFCPQPRERKIISVYY